MSKVSVGLMVYNEAAHIGQAIRSIQQQSFQDFEIVVGDNASTDGSSQIIAEMAAQDGRIVHIKRPANVGALRNWNDIVTRARGEYFVLAGGHDLWSEHYLRGLVECLDKNENAVLAFCNTQWIDNEGGELSVPTSILDTSGMSGLGKFVCLMFANQHYLYGMARISAMRRTRLQLDILGSGEIYLQELGQKGDFMLVENERWQRRKNRASEGTMDRLVRYQKVLFTNKWSRRKFKFFPFLQLMIHYLALPLAISDLPVSGRLRLFAASPLILFRYLPRIASIDIRWLFTRRSVGDR
jgi:glycosyltransferase involved in cell wall biosynthesis